VLAADTGSLPAAVRIGFSVWAKGTLKMTCSLARILLGPA
jgi:hypothetical protein